MTLIPRSFFDVERFFDDVYSSARREQAVTPSVFAPRVDIREKKDHYEIAAELAGVRKEDLHLTLEDGVLTLEAEVRQEDKDEKDGRVIRQERRYGKFSRSFTVGKGVREADITAGFDHGVLVVRIPKITEALPQKRKIDIH